MKSYVRHYRNFTSYRNERWKYVISNVARYSISLLQNVILDGAQVLTISDNLLINFQASYEQTTLLKSGKLSLIRSFQLFNSVLQLSFVN